MTATSNTADLQKLATQLYRDKLHLLYEHGFAFIAFLDENGRIAQLPEQCAFTQKYKSSLAKGAPLANLMTEEHRPALEAALHAAVTSFRPSMLTGQTRLDTAWLQFNVTPLVRAEHQPHSILVMAQDVSIWKEQESRLSDMATHDMLTGLPNRSLLLDRVSRLVSAAARAPVQFSLLLLDLDGFKLVNDTLGHDAGDLLLQEAAERLRHMVREQDTVARLGGDEFVLLLPGNDGVQIAETIAARVSEAIRQPYTLGNQPVYVSASVGCAMFPQHGATAGELLKNADTAMYRAKEVGRDQCVVYDPEAHACKGLLSMETDMHRGLERGEFYMEYQPIFSVNQELTGCESLMRWEKEDGTRISPSDFIPIAEATGLISLLGHWALRVAAKQVQIWRKKTGKNISVAVNVSPQQLRGAGFVDKVRAALKESGLPPEALVLEITEGALMRDPNRARVLLNELADMGVSISVDDFGTGYSSLSYLKSFPISSLKVDRSFVRDLETDQADRAIVKAVLSMASALGLKAVAEGVETAGQLDYIQTNGGTNVQGWLLGRPAEADVFAERFLKE